MLESQSASYVAANSALIDQALASKPLDGLFALLDFPDIRNVGDSAIWLGEMAYLRRRGRLPAYVSTMGSYDVEELKRRVPAGPILLRGGGNFGDLWPGHQAFRERVMADFPDRQIIQMPQSIHFSSDKACAKAADAIARHGAFDLLVRDRQSQQRAHDTLGCEATLCPDMAFAIGPVKPLGQSELPLLAMLRADKEMSGRASGDSLPDTIPVEDWIEELAGPVRRARWLGRLSALGTLDRQAVRLASYKAVANQRFDRGRRQLSRAEKVITDRLHVHIVSLLMGKPHAVLDNSYGKIRHFREAFPEPAGLTFAATSLAEAYDWARSNES